MRNSISVVIAALLVWSFVAVTTAAWAAPGFDLDLKELKKPVPPPGTKKSKPVTARKKPSPPPKQLPQPEVPPVETAQPTAISPSELALQAGDPCQLAEGLAVAVARSVPVDTLLHGLQLKPVAAVRYGQLDLLITCSISAAEAYTYGRLLEGHQVQLVNMVGTESAQQVFQKIVDPLAIPYQLESDGELDASQAGALVYLIPAGEDRQRALRLILRR